MKTANERRTLASRSHLYNLTQRRFVQIFPEFATPETKDLPKMTHRAPEPAAPTAPAAPRATDDAPTPAHRPPPDANEPEPLWRSRAAVVVGAILVVGVLVSRMLESA